MPSFIRPKARLQAPFVRPTLQPLETRDVPTTLLGLTTGNALVRFDSGSPGTIQSTVAVTGLQAGENLVGIDYRPASGQLVGVGSTNRIYFIDAVTGVAVAKNAVAFTPALSGTEFGIDFNPAVDKLRIVGNNGQNLRANADTGLIVGTDTNLSYDGVTYDAAIGGAAPIPQVVAAAYTKNASTTGSTVTTMYVIDSSTDILSTQGGPSDDVPAISPNGGVLFVVDKLGFDVLPNSGFDIETGTDAAFVSSGAKLYSVNLTTGGSASLGTIGSGLTIRDITIAAASTGGGTLQFSGALATFPADRSALTLTVNRTGAATDPVTVSFATADGTALAGANYTAQSGTVTFAAGETSKTIVLTVPTGPAPGTARNFTLTLSGATNGATIGTNSSITVTIPAAVAVVSNRLFAVGTGPGRASLVRVYDQATGAEVFSFAPYEPAFTGGVNVATGDVNGDGFDDVVIGTGIGGGPRVAVYSGATKAVIADFFTYESVFRGGVNVTVADVNGDGFGDILNGSGEGGGPRVRIINGDLLTNSGDQNAVIADFFAFEDTVRSGVNVSGGDVNGDGFADVLAGAGIGGGPRATLFDGKTIGTAGDRPASIQNFFAYDSATRSGVQIAIGDITGDGRAEIITGTGLGGGPNVRAFNGTTLAQVQNFFAYDSSTRGGVRVAAKDLNGDGVDDILTGTGQGSPPVVKVFRNGVEASMFTAFESTFLGGISVG